MALGGKTMKNEMKTTELGIIIRTYRIKNHLTQDELARRLGVNRNTIHLWEARGIRPSIGVLIQMSDLFQQPLSEIVRQADSPCVIRRPRRGRPRRTADRALHGYGEDGKMMTGCNGASDVYTETGGSRA